MADNLTTSLCRCHEIWNLNFLEPSGPLQACNGTDLPLFFNLAQKKTTAYKKDSNAMNAVRITDVTDMANTDRKVLCTRRQKREPRSSALLRSVQWHFLTDVSEQPICSIFQGQEIQEESYLLALLDLLLGGSLKSRKGG